MTGFHPVSTGKQTLNIFLSLGVSGFSQMTINHNLPKKTQGIVTFLHTFENKGNTKLTPIKPKLTPIKLTSINPNYKKHQCTINGTVVRVTIS